MNRISTYLGEDFDLLLEITDRKIPFPHRISIRRELEKARSFPYDNLIPPKKTLKPLDPLRDGTPLYELRPHCSGKTQYRLPLISPFRSEFLVLGFFPRKDADFNKQIAIVQERYNKIQSKQSTYELLDLATITHL